MIGIAILAGIALIATVVMAAALHRLISSLDEFTDRCREDINMIYNDVANLRSEVDDLAEEIDASKKSNQVSNHE